MKFSYALLPDHPLAESLESIRLADELGFHACYAADKIQREIAPTGVNHMICAITDRTLVKAFTGRDLPNVADVNSQLRLIHEGIMPAFA